MSYVTMEDLERLVFGGVKEWLLERMQTLQAEGRTLHALVAFGPLVQHTSAEELDLLEVVGPLAAPSTRDITNEVPLDRRFLGRIALTSLSPADLDAAITASAPLVLHILAGFKLPYDTAQVARRLNAARRSLLSA